MRVSNWHAPPFVAFLAVAVLAILVLPAFADSAGPPGQVTNEQYIPAPPDGAILNIDNANLANYSSINGALANVEPSTSFVIASANSLVTDIAYGNIVVNPGIVANDTAPPGQLAGLENIVLSTPAAQTIKEAHGDVIEHHIAGQTFAIVYESIDYPLLC